MMKTGWKLKKIGEVCEIIKGRKPELKSIRSEGDLPYLVAKVIRGSKDAEYASIKDRNSVLVSEDETIIICDGSNSGEVFTGFQGILSSTMGKIRKKIEINDEYLRFFLYSIFDVFNGSKTGSAIPHLDKFAMYSLRIPVPPLSEQRRIVAILDEVFAGIAAAKEKAEQNLKNVSEIFKSLFNNIAAPSEQAFWPKKTVSELAASQKGAIRTGPFGSQLLHTEFVDKGIAVLGIDNAVENEFQWDKKRFITVEKYQQMKRYTVYPDDVLITIMGTCGKCAVVPDNIQNAINTKHLCCITLNKKKCLPLYLHTYFLYHPLAQDFLAKHAKGAIMAGLNMGIIKELPVLLPDIERQKEIVTKFYSIKNGAKHLESAYQQKLADLEELKKSVLQQAFSGAL